MKSPKLPSPTRLKECFQAPKTAKKRVFSPPPPQFSHLEAIFTPEAVKTPSGPALESGVRCPPPGYPAAKGRHALPASLRLRPWNSGIKDHCRPTLFSGGLFALASPRALSSFPITL